MQCGMKAREKFHTLIFLSQQLLILLYSHSQCKKKASLAKEIFSVLTFTSYANFTKVLEAFFFKTLTTVSQRNGLDLYTHLENGCFSVSFTFCRGREALKDRKASR